MITDKEMSDGDTYTRITTLREFDEWCREGGWKGADDFAAQTGVHWDELRGKFFLVINNHVFTADEHDEESNHG